MRTTRTASRCFHRKRSRTTRRKVSHSPVRHSHPSGPPAPAHSPSSSVPDPEVLATRHSSLATSPYARCSYMTKDGRRCRSFALDEETTFCAEHARIVQNRKPPDRICPTCGRFNITIRVPDLVPDLLGPVQDFQSAAAINHFLARLAILQAANRIGPREANAISYTCQLLLQSLPETKREVSTARKFPEQDPVITQVVQSLPPLGEGPDARVVPNSESSP
jgi:hypothetical protein